MDAEQHTTLLSLFTDRVSKDRDRPAIHTKHEGEFRCKSWSELANDVGRTATGLKSLGVGVGDRVIQVSENRYEWVVCDFAIQFAEAIHVPVHAPLMGPQIAYQINDSDARVVLLSDQDQAAKLASCEKSWNPDTQFVSFEPYEQLSKELPIRQLASILNEIDDGSISEIMQQGLNNVTPDSLATILYTSGTTGEPKGVMLSHSNLVSNTLTTLEAFRQFDDDLRLSFLPYSHIFARTCDVYTWLATGCELAIAESRDTVLADCAAVKPTVLNGVPYFFDKVRRYLVDEGLADQEGSLRDLLGGRMRFCCSGGAALPGHVFDFWNDRGVPILQGYGLTETSPVITASTETRNRRGCVGPSIRDVELTIADDGEILTRGPHVMVGYYKNQAATDEIIQDGWFHTGDLGELEADGMLRITGRKKEIIVTALGKNVAPVYLETLLTEDPLIIQALVIGDGQNYLTALIVPDPDNLKTAIKARKIRVLSREAALKHPDVLALYEETIRNRLKDVSHHEQVRKFTLMNRGFTIESGELTPKLSLRRNIIQANCAEIIEAMYHKSS